MKAFFYTLFRPLIEFMEKVWAFIPNLLAAIAIIVFGYIVARVAKGAAERSLGLIGLDGMAERLGLTKVLEKGEITKRPSTLLAEILYALILIAFIMVGVDALDLEATDQLVKLFFLYLPRLFAALLILTLGYFIADFLARTVHVAAVNADLPHPKVFSEGIRVVVVVLIIAMALEQLSIAGSILISAFSITFGGIVLALALAFGLGGRGVAKDILERRFGKGGNLKRS